MNDCAPAVADRTWRVAFAPVDRKMRALSALHSARRVVDHLRWPPARGHASRSLPVAMDASA